VLLIDDDTIRTWHRRFQEAGVKSLKDFDYKGSASALTPAQQDALKAWVTEALPRTRSAPGSNGSSGSSTTAAADWRPC
jgi:transposase